MLITNSKLNNMLHTKIIEKEIERETAKQSFNQAKVSVLNKDIVYGFAIKELNIRKNAQNLWNIIKLSMVIYYLFFFILMPLYFYWKGIDKQNLIYAISKITGSLFFYEIQWFYEILILIFFIIIVFIVITNIISDKYNYLFLEENIKSHLDQLKSKNVYRNFEGQIHYNKKLNFNISFKVFSKRYKILEAILSSKQIENNILYYTFFESSEVFTRIINDCINHLQKEQHKKISFWHPSYPLKTS